MHSIDRAVLIRTAALAALFIHVSFASAAWAASPDELAGRIDDIRRQHGVASASVVLVDRQGLLVHRTFGVVDLASGRPADAGTRYKVGSISKAFTGLALLRAEAKELLALDAPLKKGSAGDQYQNPWESQAPLTLAMLMEHTAGWHDMSREEFDHPAKSPIPLIQALRVRPASRVSKWKPGEFSEYSNSGPGLAGHVLELAAGMPFEAFVEKELFGPLGMSSASFLPDAATLAHLAQGYDRDGRTPIPYWHILYRPSGGLNVNPRDMARFLRLLIGRGEVDGVRLFDAAQIARFERPETTAAARSGLSFGYGLGVHATQHEGHTLYTHGGDGDGYLARFAYSAEAGRGYFVVITAFNHKPLNAMRTLLADWLVAELDRPEPPAEYKLSERDLSLYTGNYRAATVRFPRPGWDRKTLKVKARNGRLYTQTEGQRPRALIAVDANRFRRAEETVATTAFTILDDGSVALQGPLGNWLKGVVE